MPGSPQSDPPEDFNQAPPFGDVDLFAIDRPLQEAVAANGAGAEAQALSSFGRHWGRAELIEQARLADKNPPRLDAGVVEFHRRLSSLHDRQHGGRAACHDLARRRDGGACAGRGRAGGALFHGGAGGERAHVPDHHDARLGGGAGGGAGACSHADAEDHLAQLRPELSPMVGEIRHDARDGHDGKTGRHRRARQSHPGGGGRRWLPHHGREMVHVRADVGCLFSAGAGAGRTDLFLHAAISSRRQRQRPAFPEIER